MTFFKEEDAPAFAQGYRLSESVILQDTVRSKREREETQPDEANRGHIPVRLRLFLVRGIVQEIVDEGDKIGCAPFLIRVRKRRFEKVQADPQKPGAYSRVQAVVPPRVIGPAVVIAAAGFHDAVVHNSPEDVAGFQGVAFVQEDAAECQLFDRLGDHTTTGAGEPVVGLPLFIVDIGGAARLKVGIAEGPEIVLERSDDRVIFVSA